MSEPDDPRTPEDTAAEEAARRRRLAEIFGDVLPETTSDERDPDERPGGRAGESATDEWLRRQVPPHHGS